MKALKLSNTIADYIKGCIWEDLNKRNFESAKAVLLVLSCQEKPDEWISETLLRQRMGSQYTQNQFNEACQWLDAVGLVEYKEAVTQKEVDRYRIRLPLLSWWITNELYEEEIQRWRQG